MGLEADRSMTGRKVAEVLEGEERSLPESITVLARGSRARETRMKRGKMDFNRPKSLGSLVTENGSGSASRMSQYDPRGSRGQVSGSCN